MTESSAAEPAGLHDLEEGRPLTSAKGQVPQTSMHRITHRRSDAKICHLNAVVASTAVAALAKVRPNLRNLKAVLLSRTVAALAEVGRKVSNLDAGASCVAVAGLTPSSLRHSKRHGAGTSTSCEVSHHAGDEILGLDI